MSGPVALPSFSSTSMPLTRLSRDTYARKQPTKKGDELFFCKAIHRAQVAKYLLVQVAGVCRFIVGLLLAFDSIVDMSRSGVYVHMYDSTIATRG